MGSEIKGVTEAGMREPVDGGAESEWSQNYLKACYQSYPAFTFNISLKPMCL